MIFCTINDFLAYGSGYSVKEHYTCPIFEKETSYIQLKHGKKTVYTRHRRFPKPYHLYRWLKKAFNRSQENESAPKPLAGNHVFDQVKDIITIFRKTQKKDASKKNIWKQNSTLFDLPCWKPCCIRQWSQIGWVEVLWFSRANITTLTCSHSWYLSWQS